QQDVATGRDRTSAVTARGSPSPWMPQSFRRHGNLALGELRTNRKLRTARRGGATMNLPGETEAGSAGRQLCRGITGRAHRADVQQRGKLTLSRCALTTRRSYRTIDPYALKIPAP